MSEDTGVVNGRYRLHHVLGHGAMGTVWQARDETAGRLVAVKEVRFPPDLPPHERELLRGRTMRKARLTAQLDHPGIVTVHDVWGEDGRCFIVMELITGLSLDDQIDASGPLPVQQVSMIGLALLDVLAVAHRAGVIHGDVRPSNVLLADDGRVVLTELGGGVSENPLTSTGLLIGSPTYMSPESLRGEASGPPADIWSLGATLYAALHAAPPFRGPTFTATIAAVLIDDVPSPRVHGPLRRALLGTLEKAPERRLSPEQMQPLLKEGCVAIPAAVDPIWVTKLVAPATPVMAPVAAPDRPAKGPPTRPRSRVLAMTLVGAAALLAVIALVIGTVQWLFDHGTEEAARRERTQSAGSTTSRAPAPFQSQALFDFSRGLVDPTNCRTPTSGEFPALEENPDVEAVQCLTSDFEVKLFRKASSDALTSERRLYVNNALLGSVARIAKVPAGPPELFDGRHFSFTLPSDDAARIYWDSTSCACGGVIVGPDSDVATVRAFWLGRGS